jgi:hypothetical protein
MAARRTDDQRFATVAGVAVLLALAAGTSAAAAPKPKPLGYLYGQCTTKTSCAYQGTTNPTQSKIALSATKLCTTEVQALGHVGYANVKPNGKFSIDKTVSFDDFQTYRTVSARVQLSGKLKVGKSVVASLKITTTAADCASETGVTKSLNLKYKYPYYGG